MAHDADSFNLDYEHTEQGRRERAEEVHQPYAAAWRQLRGRWPLAIASGLAVALLGAFAGYNFTKPQFTSVAEIGIDYTDMRWEDREPLINAQESVLVSEPLLRSAAARPEWKEVFAGSSDASVPMLRGGMSLLIIGVSHPIELKYTADDPKLAFAGAQALVEAYLESRRQADGNLESKRRRMAELQAEQQRLDAKREEIGPKLAHYGLALEVPSAINDRQGALRIDRERLMAERNDLDSDLRKLRQQLSNAKAQLQAAEISTRDLTPTQVASVDEMTFELLTQRRTASAQLESFRQRHGQQHPTYRTQHDRLVAEIENLDASLAARTRAFVDQRLLPWREELTRLNSAEAQVVERVEEIDQQLAAIQNDFDTLGAAVVLAGQLKDHSERLGLERYSKPLSDRIEVLRWPTLSPGPSKDRRKLFAVAGAGSGFLGGVALVALSGLAVGRLRFVSDLLLIAKHVPLFVALPTITKRARTPQERQLLSHCMQSLRGRVQHLSGESPRSVLLSSAAAEEGKTSIAEALAISLSTSGAKTLVCDLDIEGRGLTTRLGVTAHRRLGDLLVQREYVTPKQIAHALDHRHPQQRIGEALLAHGFVTEDVIQNMLADQEKTSVGLREFILGEPLEACITSIKHMVGDLHMLPVGDARSKHLSRLNGEVISRLIAEARELGFEFVIVDSGPLMGSLEAEIAARNVDHVLLVTRRGTRQQDVVRLLPHCAGLNVKPAGIIFNDADPTDITAATSTYRSVHPVSSPTGLLAPDMPELERSGSVGLAGALRDTLSNSSPIRPVKIERRPAQDELLANGASKPNGVHGSSKSNGAYGAWHES